VTLAVGRHTRLPRTYRGMDIFWWLDMIGAFDRTIDSIADVASARREPSLQLVGRPDRGDLDLAALQAAGVRLVGRVHGISDERVTLGSDLGAMVEAADHRMGRILDRIDDAAARLGLDAEVLDRELITTASPSSGPRVLDLHAAGIDTVVWATGHRRSYDWLDLPIFDSHGEIDQRRGVTPMPGAYVLGQRFQHRRDSNFIDGVGRDAAFVADHIDRSRPTHCVFSTPLIDQN
jgi:putative flavoprotein involved in K+ transport